MRERLLEVEFKSDWHIGSGAGIPGSVDRQVLRDEDGFPYIPGKTLTGILRDAAEFIADIRDRHKPEKEWKKVCAELFGEQPVYTDGGDKKGNYKEAAGAKIGISSAELPQDVRDYILAVRDRYHIPLEQALFTLQPGVKIDVKTGRALDDHLFSTEKARGDCVTACFTLS